ncbi:formin-like protein 5 [Coturnix japonica]|uniref:formin-like protein 5 n=1 Tax=Coturnix japonica TaxID=93934 RepID=UPI0013A5DFDF|nr:formin-like protein 5 [Coturnix japonica]
MPRGAQPHTGTQRADRPHHPELPGSQRSCQPPRGQKPPQPQGTASSKPPSRHRGPWLPMTPAKSRRHHTTTPHHHITPHRHTAPPSRPRSHKVSLPGPHRSFPSRQGERQPRRPIASRERATPTNARRREAEPRGPAALRSGGSASRRAGTAPRLTAPQRRSPRTCRCLRLLPGRPPLPPPPPLPPLPPLPPPPPAGFSAAGAGPQLAAGA